MLTTTQALALKAAITAETDPGFVVARNGGSLNVMAAFYNVEAVPAFVVWKSQLSRHEILTGVGPTGTVFDWASAGGYIARSQGERDAWREMFNDTGTIPPGATNIQAAIADIFSGSGAGAVNNRNHILALSKRNATRGEKVFATGTGTTLAPATMGREGDVTVADIEQALAA